MDFRRAAELTGTMPIGPEADGSPSGDGRWDGVALGKTLAAVGGIGAVSQYLAFSALKRRTTP